MYADDTHLYQFFALHQIKKAVDELPEDLQMLVNLSSRHSFHLNSKKTSALVFRPKSKRTIVQERIKLYKDRVNQNYR